MAAGPPLWLAAAKGVERAEFHDLAQAFQTQMTQVESGKFIPLMLN
jgi:hypothetical protein